MQSTPDLHELVRRVLGLGSRQPAGRILVGIAGAPGAGKSTLARALTAALRAELGGGFETVANVPMDGYHLADVELRRLGLLDRKGAPDTFDAAGFRSLIERLRAGHEDVWAPAFDRKVEQPIAGSIPVPASVRFVITEGNYLLLDTPPWAQIRDLLDEVWFVEVAEPLRVDRLVARHVEYGRTPAEAAARATTGSDADNARLVAASRARADLIVDTAEWLA